MYATLITLILLFALVTLWLDGARARELAVAISKAACDRHGLQLLDDTVYLQRIGIRWTDQGIRLRRMFRFEYSAEGILRQTGYILLLGTALESIHISGTEKTSTPPGTEQEPERKPADNVIPFGKRKH